MQTDNYTQASGLPQQGGGDMVTRLNPCSFCEEGEGTLLAKPVYWDLVELNLIRCKGCGLTQLDPMLTTEQMATGCLALYRFQQTTQSNKYRIRSLRRGFRRGVAFGLSLKLRGFKPTRVLEIGAGDGFFSRGIQFVFPEAQFVALDLVPEILEYIQLSHGFDVLEGTPEDLDPKSAGKFDLIIARDILEHLAFPQRALKFITESLSTGGYFHFITPNGYQDVWAHYSLYTKQKLKSELLINHVNYFEPNGLRLRLVNLGLQPVTWFIHNFRGTKKGVGFLFRRKLMAPPNIKRSSQNIIASTGTFVESQAGISPESVLGNIGSSKFKQLFYLWYAFLIELPLLRLPARYGVGHEIFGTFKKI